MDHPCGVQVCPLCKLAAVPSSEAPHQWWRGRLPQAQESFFSHSSLQRSQVPSWFSLFFILSYTVTWGYFLPFQNLRTSVSVQYAFFENGSTNVFFGVDVFLMYLWQEMSAMSCYSTILITPLWLQVIIHLSKPTEHVIQEWTLM